MMLCHRNGIYAIYALRNCSLTCKYWAAYGAQYSHSAAPTKRLTRFEHPFIGSVPSRPLKMGACPRAPEVYWPNVIYMRADQPHKLALNNLIRDQREPNAQPPHKRHLVK